MKQTSVDRTIEESRTQPYAKISYSLPAYGDSAVTAANCYVWIANVYRAGFPLSLLSQDELARLSSYRQEADRRRFVAGCAVTRIFLAQRLNTPPESIEIDRTCPRCGEPHGKPRVVGVAWQHSVSHSGEDVVVAFSERDPIGIDLESLDNLRSKDVWASVLSPSELRRLRALPASAHARAFLTYWTRKEALLKCVGTGLTVEPRLLQVSGPDQTPSVEVWPDELATSPAPRLYDLPVVPGSVSSLAILAPAAKIHVSKVTSR